MLNGSCYCGEIAIQLDDAPAGGVICSCVTCAKLHSQHSYNVQSELAKLTVTKGKPSVYNDTKTDSGKGIARSFCGNCGSALFSVPEMMPGAVFVKVGCLDDAATIPLAAQIYVEKAYAFGAPDKATHGHKTFEGMMAKEV